MAVIAAATPFSVCYGGTAISIDGATPAVLAGVTAGNPHWLIANTKLIYQNVSAGAILQTLTLPATLATASGSGQNGLGAGAGVWAAYLAGVRTSTPPSLTLPLAGLYDVSELGQIAVVDIRGSASGLTVYTAAGAVQYHVDTVLLNPTVHVRQNLLSYQDVAGWHLIDLTTLGPVKGFLPRAHISNFIPFRLGTTPAVFEYDAATAIFSIRPATSLNGLTVGTGGFNPDIVGTGLAACRLAWTTGAGEQRTELVILDVNTATRATSRGVVVGTSMSFSVGPILAGTAFSGADAASLYLPVQQQPLVDPKTGTITKPWRDALQKVSGSVTGAISQINNLPAPPVNPDTVIGTPPSTDNALARYDGTTGTLIQNSLGILNDVGSLTGLTHLDVEGDDADSQIVSGSGVAGGIVAINAQDTYSDITLGASIAGGLYMPAQTAFGIVYQDATDVSVGLEVPYATTPNTPWSGTPSVGINVGAPGTSDTIGGHLFAVGGLGAGAKAGLIWRISRNSSGSGAAGALALERRDGTVDDLWTDTGGTLRSGSAAPTENNSVSDTSGIEVANQTFTHAFLLGGM